MLVLLLSDTKEESLAPFFHQVFTPFYFAAPACFHLYLTSFVNHRTRLRRSEWLHFTPVVLAIIHIFPWPFSHPVNWTIIATQLSENRQLFISEKSGIFPAYFHYLGRPALLLIYLFAAWYEAIRSTTIPARGTGDTGRKWIFLP